MSNNMLGNALREYTGLRHQLDQNLLGEKGEEWQGQLKRFLRKEPCWSKITHQLFTPSEKNAADTLGSERITGYLTAHQIWGVELSENSLPVILFSKDVLKQCAEENKNGADWRVVYVHGFSLRKQEEIRGRDRDNQPCFDPDWTWWLKSSEKEWSEQPVEAGYRLFDFSGRFGNKTHEEQDILISKTGFDDEWAEEQAVTEACFTFYLLSGGKERLLPDFYHRGKLVDSDGDRVVVGDFDDDGFSVGNFWFDRSSVFLQVVLSRK